MPWYNRDGSRQSRQTLVAQSQLVSSEGSTRILNPPNFSSDSHLEHPEVFPCQNGSTSSKGRQSTSTKSSPRYTVSQLIKRERLAWETLKSVSVELKQNRKLNRVLNGVPHGSPLREQLLLFSNTENGSWGNMETTLNDCSLLSSSDAKVRFSSVLPPFLKNREPNRQSLCRTEPEPELNRKNRFFWFCSVLKPVRTAEPILKPNLLYRVYLLIY